MLEDNSEEPELKKVKENKMFNWLFHRKHEHIFSNDYKSWWENFDKKGNLIARRASLDCIKCGAHMNPEWIAGFQPSRSLEEIIKDSEKYQG